ncbi:MAG TPA: heavy metal-responsive transcriptional regulator [Thermoanaerobaculia bacterium]|nr:heavy metal-responsive transcriptional regulator [Thermoanaerobaculia bacterium]
MPLKIGEVARRTGVSVAAIRYYERLGLVGEPPRSASGYRQFEDGVIRRLGFIQQAQALGFSLQEIAELLDLRSSPAASASEVRELAQAKLADVETKIADLARIHGALLAVIRSCTGSRPTSECPILEALECSTGGR